MIISSALTGVPQGTLQTWLGQAQQALQNLMTGAQTQTVTYAQGEGSRSVTYTRTNMEQLRSWIGELQQALGATCGRRAVGVVFR